MLKIREGRKGKDEKRKDRVFKYVNYKICGFYFFIFIFF